MRIVELDLAGEVVLVEVPDTSGSQLTGRLDAAQARIADAATRIETVIASLALSTVNAAKAAATRAAKPSQVEVEFGLKFTVDGNIVVAGSSGEASLKIKLTYGEIGDEVGGEGDDE